MSIGCKEWTVSELELLYNTLDEYILADYLTGKLEFVRMREGDYSGLHVGLWEGGVNKLSQIKIYDRAWITPPAAGAADMFDFPFRKRNNFQGTIAHELTHAAMWFHPELLDWWKDAQEQIGIEIGQGNLMIGFLYHWRHYNQFKDDPEMYDDLVQAELFALAIGAAMYDPIWHTGQ